MHSCEGAGRDMPFQFLRSMFHAVTTEMVVLEVNV